MFRMFELFWFFCVVQEDGFLYRMTCCVFFVSITEQCNVSLFLDFFLLLNFKTQELFFFLTVFITLCPFSSHSCFLHSIVVLQRPFLFVILIFQFLELSDFSCFLDFSSFLWFTINFIQHKAVLRGC